VYTTQNWAQAGTRYFLHSTRLSITAPFLMSRSILLHGNGRPPAGEVEDVGVQLLAVLVNVDELTQPHRIPERRIGSDRLGLAPIEE